MYSMKTDLMTRKTKIFRTELLVESKAFVYPGLLPADTNKNIEIEKSCQAFGIEKQFVSKKQQQNILQLQSRMNKAESFHTH